MARRDVYLYQQIADKIAQDIDSGLYVSGDKLPSLRSLVRHFQVSLATAVQALTVLESQGRVEARPKSGYYVLPVIKTAPPAISRSSRSANKVSVGQLAQSLVEESRSKGLIRLGAAVPGTDLLPLGKLGRSLAGASRRHYLESGVYGDSQGHIDLRRAIARLMKTCDVSCKPGNIIVTNGCLEALTLSLRAITKPGDTVALESPTYFGVLQVMESLGLKALELATHPNEGIDLTALKYAVNHYPLKACVLMPSFSNPLGALMPNQNKRQVVHLLEKNQIPLIEDDVYGSLSHSGRRPPSAKSFEQHGGVIYCSSISKILAPGYRLGWIAAGRYHEKIAYQKFLGNISTSSIPQLALSEYLHSPGFRRQQQKNISVYRQRMEQLRHTVLRYFPSDTPMTEPQGGFILWVELPKEVDCMKLYVNAIQKGVAISPGVLFSAKPQYRHHIRLSCGVVQTDEMKRGIKILAKLISK